MKRSEVLAVVLIAGVWNSIVAWLLIGVVWGIIALGGKAAFDPGWILIWPLIVVLGYVQLWKDERS